MDNALYQQAKSWIETAAASGKWRVHVMSRKYRRDKTTGKRKSLPFRIRRFIEGCPVAAFPEVIDLLLEAAPYPFVFINKRKFEGSFRPTNTEWRRDDDIVINGTRRTDGTYTLVQDLVDDTLEETLDATISSSCTELVTAQYEWDSGSPPESLPEPEQGVTWGIQQLSRNDDGSFHYALVRRQALTQSSGQVVTSDNQFDTTYTITFKNLYGESPDFTDHTGAAVAVPTPGAAPSGELVEWQTPVKNDDCTYNLVVVRKVSKGKTSERSSKKTIYEHSESQVDRGENNALPDAPAAKGGLVVSHKTELRPDGKHDNTVQKNQEKPVKSASVEVEVTLRGRRKTTVNRNMPADAPAPTKVGQKVRNEKTEGGLVTQTITESDKTPVGEIREGCVNTASEHTDTTVSNVAVKPTLTHLFSRGRIVEFTAELTEYETYDVTKRVRTAKPVSHTTEYGTVLRKVSQTAYKNADSVDVAPGGVNRETAASLTRNEFDLIDGTVSRTEYLPAVLGPISAGNIFSRTAYTFGKNVTDVPGGTGGVNTEVALSANANDHGSYDYTFRKTTFMPYGPVVVATTEGLIKSTVIRSAYNQTTIANETGGTNVELSASANLNTHGSFDWTIRRDVYKPYGPVTLATVAGTLKTTTVEGAYNQTTVTSRTGGVNEDVSVSAHLNAHGSFDWTARTDKYVAYGPELVTTTESPVLVTRHYIGMNLDTPVSHASGNTVSSMSVSMNPYGSFNTNETVRSPKGLVKDGYWYTGSGKSRRRHDIKVYRNQERILTLDGYHSASASASINEFGLVDGSAVSVGGNGEDGAGDDTWMGAGGTVTYWETFQVPGGKRYRQPVVLSFETCCDVPANVKNFISEGHSYGPYHSGFSGSGGRTGDGRALMMGIRYSAPKFGEPEEIA